MRHFFFWIFRWCSFGKFYMVKFNYFTARPERRKSGREVLKYFRLITMLAIYEIKMLLVRIKKYLYQCRPSLLCRSVHTGCYIYNSLIHMIYLFICIVYLHVIETCLKLWFLSLIFWHLKSPSNVMKNIVNSISIYSWKKLSLSANISSKCIVIKIILYFLTSWKMAKFFLQKFVISNMMTDPFLVEK